MMKVIVYEEYYDLISFTEIYDWHLSTEEYSLFCKDQHGERKRYCTMKSA